MTVSVTEKEHKESQSFDVARLATKFTLSLQLCGRAGRRGGGLIFKKNFTVRG